MKLSIGQVSKIFDISKDTLRYYDKIGILKPQVNESNGYRYYYFKDLEKLGLVIGIKYLGISLEDIKNTIESEDIHEYKKLVLTQEGLINKKILELKALQEDVSKRKKTLNKIIDSNNEYDFSKLKITYENYDIYGIEMRSILNLDTNNKDEVSLGRELANLNEEDYIYIYNIIENKEVDDNEEIVFISGKDKIINLLKKYEDRSDIEVFRRSVNGKHVSASFYGTINEIEDYIILMNEYFKCEKNNIAYVIYEFYLPKKDDEVKYFIDIKLKL